MAKIFLIFLFFMFSHQSGRRREYSTERQNPCHPVTLPPFDVCICSSENKKVTRKVAGL